MKTALKIVAFLAAVAAVVAYWELNHPFSYTHYRQWISNCRAAAANPAGCDLSFDDWMQRMMPAVQRRDPATSEKHGGSAPAAAPAPDPAATNRGAP